MISIKHAHYKSRGIAFSVTMLLLLSVIVSIQNTFVNTVYADHNDGNNNKKVMNKSLISDISDQVVNTPSNKEGIQNILQLIQIQILQISGQDKATKTINLINSIINLNPNGPLSQSLLYLSKQQAIGNVNSVIEAAVEVAAHVANGGEDIEEIIKHAASHTQQVLSSQSPSMSSISSSPSLQLSLPQQPLSLLESSSSSPSQPALQAALSQGSDNNNNPPLANAGHEPAQKTVNAGSRVILDGSQSYDPDGGTITSYQWSQVSGPTVALSGADTRVASFTAPSNLAADTELVFRLIVTDTDGLSDVDTVSILVKHTVTIPPPTGAKDTLVYKLTSSEKRTILPIQMQYPDGTWSQPVKYNFDTGASSPTDVAPQFLAAFGYGPDGVGTDSSKRKEQPSKIRIVGLDGEFDLPVMVQDKAHYDLFRKEPPPTRYPLLRVKDILTKVTMVFTSEQTTLRLRNVPIPELADTSKLIYLPDFQRRDGTPTSGWQWVRVKFVNPSTGAGIEDWFGLNTGDYKIVLKKESVADKIKLSLKSTDSCNYDSKSTIDFIEASKPVRLDSAAVQVRKETCQFARGGEPRNFGGGIPFLAKYTLILWDLHRALLPV